MNLAQGVNINMRQPLPDPGLLSSWGHHLLELHCAVRAVLHLVQAAIPLSCQTWGDGASQEGDLGYRAVQKAGRIHTHPCWVTSVWGTGGGPAPVCRAE